MNTECSGRTRTSTAMADWIDEMFDVMEGRVDEALRDRLLDLADTAFLEDREEAIVIDAILDEGLTQDEGREWMRRLVDAQPRVPDMYAPSQTMLARWIRSFCL